MGGLRNRNSSRANGFGIEHPGLVVKDTIVSGLRSQQTNRLSPQFLS